MGLVGFAFFDFRSETAPGLAHTVTSLPMPLRVAHGHSLRFYHTGMGHVKLIVLNLSHRFSLPL